MLRRSGSASVHAWSVSHLLTPGTPEPEPVDPRALAQLASAFSRVDELWRRFDIAVLTPPNAESPAAADLPDTMRAYAHDHAATAIRTALDHLKTWKLLVEGSGLIPTHAHLSLLRTAHESAFTACWLADPAIDAAMRLARGVAAQAADYDERRKAETAMGRVVADPPGKLAVDRLRDLMAKAEIRGLTRLNKQNQPILTVGLPPVVELFNLYEPARPPAKGEYVYRLLSGFAHGKQWATTLGLQQQTPIDFAGRSLGLV